MRGRIASRAAADTRANTRAAAYRSSILIDWSVSQRRSTWISTTHPSRPPTAHRCGAGSRSTSPKRRSSTGPGALEDEDQIVAARRAWQGKLAEGGLAGVTWPKEYGGQGLGPIESGHLQPGDRPRQGARHPRRDRRRHARTDDHRPRHRRAEVPLSRPDAPRRRGLVPALLRARRGLRPRGRADPRAPAGRRQLAADGTEGVDHQRPVRLLRTAARPHRRRRAQAQGPDDVRRADGRRRA